MRMQHKSGSSLHQKTYQSAVCMLWLKYEQPSDCHHSNQPKWPLYVVYRRGTIFPGGVILIVPLVVVIYASSSLSVTSKSMSECNVNHARPSGMYGMCARLWPRADDQTSGPRSGSSQPPAERVKAAGPHMSDGTVH